VIDLLEDLKEKFKNGDIVVAKNTTKEMVPYLKKASGIICEEMGDNALIIGMALDIPVITGARGATKILKSGTVVTMDASHGHVYNN